MTNVGNNLALSYKVEYLYTPEFAHLGTHPRETFAHTYKNAYCITLVIQKQCKASSTGKWIKTLRYSCAKEFQWGQMRWNEMKWNTATLNIRNGSWYNWNENSRSPPTECYIPFVKFKPSKIPQYVVHWHVRRSVCGVAALISLGRVVWLQGCLSFLLISRDHSQLP